MDFGSFSICKKVYKMLTSHPKLNQHETDDPRHPRKRSTTKTFHTQAATMQETKEQVHPLMGRPCPKLSIRKLFLALKLSNPEKKVSGLQNRSIFKLRSDVNRSKHPHTTLLFRVLFVVHFFFHSLKEENLN